MLFSDRELYVSITDGFTYSFGRFLTVVFNDNDFNELTINGDIATEIEGLESWPLIGINYTNAFTSSDIANELSVLLRSGRTGGFRVSYYTYNEFLSVFGLICFIGFFMCAMFVLMTASMLYFKQVAIATEEKAQYQMLKKIGVDSDIESKIIGKRLLPIFVIPLLMGIIHSIFAMKSAHTMMDSGMIPSVGPYLDVLKISAIMYVAYAAVYTVFYFVTKGRYKQIVR